MKQHFTVGNSWYGTSERQMTFVHAQSQVPSSYAFCCTVCGEVWARCGVEHPQAQWMFLNRGCPVHARQLEVPGSVWVSWDSDYNNSLPAELLRRELELHLSLWEP